MGTVLAAIAHDVAVREGPFASVADASEAIKIRAAQLRLPYDASSITVAIALVERSRRVICPDCARLATLGAREEWAGGYNEPIACACGFVGERSTRIDR